MRVSAARVRSPALLAAAFGVLLAWMLSRARQDDPDVLKANMEFCSWRIIRVEYAYNMRIKRILYAYYMRIIRQDDPGSLYFSQSSHIRVRSCHNASSSWVSLASGSVTGAISIAATRHPVHLFFRMRSILPADLFLPLFHFQKVARPLSTEVSAH